MKRKFDMDCPDCGKAMRVNRYYANKKRKMVQMRCEHCGATKSIPGSKEEGGE